MLPSDGVPWVSRQNSKVNPRRPTASCVTLLFMVLTTASCSSINGFPDDPENTPAVRASVANYFDPKLDAAYGIETDPSKREQLRNLIVLNRMRSFDLEFDQFERSLYGNANALSTGSDLAVLALGAVGATTGGAAAKAALSAASAAVVGAEGAMSKDLYYQRTMPALLAQMDANRATVKIGIIQGLKLPDSAYPLAAAYVDLELLKKAGSIPAAISTVTQHASDNAATAEEQLQAVRNVSFTSSMSATKIQLWLHPNGTLDINRSAALFNWMKGDQQDRRLPVPIDIFLASSSFEQSRQRAIRALAIK
ncbi:hypothetical protein ACMDCR_28225 [Labrys okinawensis]|uniref:hypothetical protein n=1 Tax=Labrys okinawensis TaxID=346911 RepID=UPI0039BD4CC5